MVAHSILLCVFFAALALSPLRAQIKGKSELLVPHEPLSLGEDFLVHRISNGLTLIIVESSRVPLNSSVMCMRNGSTYESVPEQGLSMLWEQTLLSHKIPSSPELVTSDYLAQKGIKFSTESSPDRLMLALTGTSQAADSSIQLLSSLVSSSILEADYYDEDLRKMLLTINSAEKSGAVALNTAKNNLLYKELAHTRHIFPSVDQLSRLSRQAYLNYRHENWLPDESALLLSGNFKLQEMISKVEHYFSSWKRPEYRQPNVTPEYPNFKTSTTLIRTDDVAKRVHIQYTFVGPSGVRNVEDTYALDLLTVILNQRKSKFSRDWVESGLASYAGLTYVTERYAGEINLSLATTAANAPKVLKAFSAYTKSMMKDSYFTAQELQRAKYRMASERALDGDRPSQYLQNLCFWFATTGLDYYRDYMNQLFKVEVSDLRRVVGRYIAEKPYLSSILLSQKDAKIAKLYDTSKPRDHDAMIKQVKHEKK